MTPSLFPHLSMKVIKLLFLVILVGGLVPCALYFSAVSWKSNTFSVPFLFNLSIFNTRIYGDDTDLHDSPKHSDSIIRSMGFKSGDHGTTRSNLSDFGAGDSGGGNGNDYVAKLNGTSGTPRQLLVGGLQGQQNPGQSPTSANDSHTTRAFSETQGSSTNITEPCPQTPPISVGRITVNKTTVTEAELNIKYQSTNNSGHFKPGNCRSENKTAVIIPYRNREHHIWILLNNLIPFLVKQQLEFSIFVVEPAANVTFNRGLLMNVGFLEALKVDDFACFVFHDVDLVPENDKNVYRCAAHPRHHSAANSKYNYRLPYYNYVGGVISISKDQYTKINGISNLYFGWGGEDDDLFNRLHSKGFKILRYPMEIGRYFSLPHGRDKGNPASSDRFRMLGHWKKRTNSDGLNSIRYSVETRKFKNLFIWIYISVDWKYYKSQIKKIHR
ncbi:beta-1,4-N-acetylgalactosaminyltransferase bre-4-like [Gigantopelta aegis]|uniref:beta-1,4-N-acetylgalactosaminyltransferase bre-4-like n=1 Tax=Gigantopelta aegis TaxID=1735272 RepID=UPI001B889B06|nr:beta-1,4-N-acetylgalactosaminyltransferase bre-4-like [Gigantopelta aegis]